MSTRNIITIILAVLLAICLITLLTLYSQNQEMKKAMDDTKKAMEAKTKQVTQEAQQQSTHEALVAGLKEQIQKAEVTIKEIKEGLSHLVKLIPLFSRLSVVVMSGRKAQKARAFLQRSCPYLELIDMFHPSPHFINRARGNGRKIVNVLRKQVKKSLFRTVH